LAGELVDNLMEQIAPFNPGFTLGEKAQTLTKMEDGNWCVTTNEGTKHIAPNVAIAGGLGVFTPRKPPIDQINKFEKNGVDYMVKDPEKYRDKRIVISGGGDSALDWSIFLSDVASEVSLVHRRTGFRGALDSVEKVMNLAEQGKINLITNAEVNQISGNGHLQSVGIKIKDAEDKIIEADYFIPLFGLKPTLGPIGEWGLEIEKGSIKVDTTDYSTNLEGVYAIGDINTYEGKLKLILCGFHEGTIMVQSAFKRIYPDKNLVLKYTTVNGVNGF
jgi:thioredoxin reductase (NADPH)